MIDGYVGVSEDEECVESVCPPHPRGRVALPGKPLISKQALRLRLQLSLIALDVFCIATAFSLSSFVRFGSSNDPRSLQFLALLLPWYATVAANTRAYSVDAVIDPRFGAKRAALALATAAALIAGLLFYLKTSTLYSRQVVGVGVAGAAVFVAFARCAFLSGLGGGDPHKLTNEVLLIDGAPVRPEPGSIVIIADTAGEEWEPPLLHRIGTFLHNADRVIVAASEDRRRRWVTALKGVGVDVEVLATELARIGPIGLRQYGSHPTLVVGSKPLGVADSFKKRVLDLGITSFALLLAAPLLVLIAAAIKLDTPGPIIFRQNRLGQGNRIFAILKFRTMRVETEDRQGNRSAARLDERITRVGSFLRRTSLDELPQLFNVLAGHMSIVGPRPHALGSTAEEALFWIVDGRYWERHGVKPGITGLAQVRGYRGATDSKADVINRVQSDLEYTIGWSVSRDLSIMFRTLGVLVHHNAY